jgi:hypothetical protein
MKMKKSLWIATLILPLTLFSPGCGGGPDTDPVLNEEAKELEESPDYMKQMEGGGDEKK